MNEYSRPINTIELEAEPYIVEFVCGLYNQQQPIDLSAHMYLGKLISERINRVPEDCRYIPKKIPDSRRLSMQVKWLKDYHAEHSLDPTYYYYLPTKAQKVIVSAIKELFDAVFFMVIDMTAEYTDEQIKNLIESFCQRYQMAFEMHYETLKKKYYRARKNEKNETNFCPKKKR
jgi:hypothetical protein